MTSNQISYWRLQEDKRHNLESERYNIAYLSEVKRHNIVGENETHRHNVAGENISWANLNESIRSHRAQESLSARALAETKRHNKAGEYLSSQTLYEQRRSNKAREGMSWYYSDPDHYVTGFDDPEAWWSVINYALGGARNLVSIGNFLAG